MKIIGKIILAVFSALAFLGAALAVFTYYAGGLSDYLYYSQEVVEKVFFCGLIILFLLALLIGIIVVMFKCRKKIFRIVCTVFLIVLIPLEIYFFFAVTVVSMVLGPNGCSYTEDIANYGVYDNELPIPYFPETITEDMTVVDFAYYYKHIDRSQIDIYLEVRFDDRETMERYLTEAKKAFSEKGTIEYQNPYNEAYTDVIGWSYWKATDQWEIGHNYVSFGGDEDYRYVDTYYSGVSYSYEELTVIYHYTDVGNDLEIGDDPDQAEYYPKIFRRFGVEWNSDNGFRSKDLVGISDE